MLSIFTTYFLPAIILAGIGGFFGVIISVCAKAFYVKVDERIEKVTSMLPGYNCGGCGNPGCTGLATKIVEENCNITLCKVLKSEQVEEIKKYLEEAKKDLEKEE